ncbi:unnamed protein product [Cylicocyclus nassatus]|uniref:ShKT domain-containing protein n=1 Tax=Cylicocyclus nassatus TaxID=53992 RepID=A0AA36H192_CYLNA|nr:unnamed protein product [Cylicocyclus nassatus]
MLSYVLAISVVLLVCSATGKRERFTLEEIIQYKPIVKRQAECGHYSQCGSWKTNGFCNNHFFPTDVKQHWCGKACGLC